MSVAPTAIGLRLRLYGQELLPGNTSLSAVGRDGGKAVPAGIRASRSGRQPPEARGADAVQVSPRTLYLDLAGTLKEEIAAGMYEVGEKLPTEIELCGRFGVSRS